MAIHMPATRVVRRQLPFPPLLKPLLKAYVLGYASSVIPRLLTLLITHLGKKRRSDRKTEDDVLSSLVRILRGGLEWQRFPTFCAALVGGSTLLQIPLRRVFARLASNLTALNQQRITTWLSTFIAAWFSIKLLQSKDSDAFMNKAPSDSHDGMGNALKSIKFAGRTMDLTLFALTRAADVVVGDMWARRRARKMRADTWSGTDAVISYMTDPSIFAASCAFIMWSWIYKPERLPRAYNKWIQRAAAVDMRLIQALRRCQWGEFIYGKETGQADVLQPMCIEYGWPEVWGDPCQTVPIPCEMVHMGTGPNCEWHAVKRFVNGFTMALGMYGPIQLVLQLRNPSKSGAKNAIISSIRSSTFLGAFIALYFYGVCLARTRIGPRVLGTDVKSRQAIDSGICIGTGCMVCGWSIILENAGRRKDIALFVAPRALATLLPRRYEMKYQWKETATFAFSTAVVFTCIKENPSRVRGVFGKLLSGVLV